MDRDMIELRRPADRGKADEPMLRIGGIDLDTGRPLEISFPVKYLEELPGVHVDNVAVKGWHGTF